MYTSIINNKKKDSNDKVFYDVCVFYSHTENGIQERLSKSTGVKVLPSNITKGGEISSKHPNYQDEIKKIEDKQKEIEKVIQSYIDATKKKPTKEDLVKLLNSPNEVIQKTYSDMMDYMEDFIEWKSGELSAETSIKHYTNLRTDLKMFKEVKNYNLSFSSVMEEKWIKDYVNFLLYEKKDPHLKKKNPKKGLNNNVATKRLRNFCEFLSYCIVEKDININLERIKHYIKRAKKKNKVQTYKPTKFSLTLDELQHFVYYVIPKKHPEHFQKFKDLMILSSLTGFRFKDTQHLNKSNAFNINVEATKTGAEALKLPDMAIEILEKYNYNMHVNEQNYRFNLKEIFKGFFIWYKAIYEKRTGEVYPLTVFVRKKNGTEVITEEKFKYEMCSNHLGRKTFANILLGIEGLSIQDLMLRGGWKRLETVQGYVDERQNLSKEVNIIPITRGVSAKLIKKKAS